MAGNVNARKRWGKIRDTLKTPLGKRGTTRPRQYWPEGDLDELDRMETTQRMKKLSRSMSQGDFDPFISEEQRQANQIENAQAAADVFRDPSTYPFPEWSPPSSGGYGAAPYDPLNGGAIQNDGGKTKSKSKYKYKSKSKSKSKSKGRKSKGRKSKGRKSKGRKSKGRKKGRSKRVKSKRVKSKGRKGRKSKSKRK